MDFTVNALLTNYKTVALCTYDMYGMLQRTSRQRYTVRTGNSYEHFKLWKFCSIMCSSCEGHRQSEGSVNVLIISCSCVLVRTSLKDTSSTNSSTPRTLVVASTNSRALFSHVRYEPTIYKRQPDTVFFNSSFA